MADVTKFAEVLATYEAGTNPRWVACHVAIGRRPVGWEFMVWNSQRWQEFAALQGCKTGLDASASVFLKLGHEAHEKFDTWLRETVDGGAMPESWRTP